MNKTSNYQLCQWDGDDRILRTDFNEDNAKIDTALKQQANSIAGINSTLPGKADATTVTSLTNKLNTEIQERKDTVTAEAAARAQADNTEKAAREAADTAEAQARAQGDAAEAAARVAGLALKGNCQIYCTTYTGNGEESRTITFPAKPRLVTIAIDAVVMFATYGTANALAFTSANGYRLPVTWSGNSMTISKDGLNPNADSTVYQVTALIQVDE